MGEHQYLNLKTLIPLKINSINQQEFEFLNID